VAALATPESFTAAGRAGHAVMAIPMAGGRMAELVRLYREGWRSAGHPGQGRVMLAFHMVCHASRGEAERIARTPLEDYFRSLVDAASDWTGGLAAADYPGYDKIIDGLRKTTFHGQIESGGAWIGTPADILEQIDAFARRVGPFESASLQVNFNTIAFADAERSVRLFSDTVMPRLARR
jgi:alkanesulfonate monooxygenase SsuD/methylene tetrahydromethanopterin reductase-like flavin-dependent oxidoreductase (luciferase family)